jgi:hypothetical protein
VHRTVRCTTGHCPMQISFLFWRSRPLAFWSRWRTGHCLVHTGSDRWPGHASRADCAADRWLTGQSGAPPDSPVIYSHTLLTCFPRAATSLQLTHRTVRCTIGQSSDLYPYAAVEIREQAVHQTPAWRTGQSGAPKLSRVLAARAKSFPFVFSLILALRQVC